MRALQPFVPIESVTRDRAHPEPPIPAPEVGLRWGAPAQFTFDEPTHEAERRKGLTIRWPALHKKSVRVRNMTPVWRRFDVMRVKAETGTDHVDVRVTREVLIPLGSSTQRFIGIGTGYVEDPGGAPHEERVVHSFLRLEIPPPALVNAEKIEEGEEGQWPDLPEEMVPPGRYSGGATSWGPHYAATGGWSR